MSGWMLWRLKSDFFLKAAPSRGFFGAQGAPGGFCKLVCLLSFLPSLKFYFYPFDALRPRRAPTFCPCRK